MSDDQRRLATVMFTDMVGYSALVQKNEALALELLEEQRALLRAAFAEHGGREVEAVGDGFFVEFPSALSAARCAVAIQQRLAERNRVADGGARIQVRIGLHVGDVVVRGHRVHGDVVNIAARIEPLAPPSGILVSEDVARQIQNKIDLPLLKLGKGELKNIQLAVDIYRIVLSWEQRQLPLPERVVFALRRKRTRRIVAGAAAILVVLAVAGAHVTRRMTGRLGAAPARRVAVLPFGNMSGNADDEYFSDGITEELISRLSRVAGLEVIARTSVMSYKGTAKKVPEIGRELSAGSILEGSVRKAGSKVRITAQLVHADNQAHLWSEDYDRDLTDIFAVQGDIAQRVADALRVKLADAEKQQLAKNGTDDLEAYALYLKGRFSIGKRTEEGIRTAIGYFQEAIAKDPAYALAYAGLGASYVWLARLVPSVRPRDAYPKAAAAVAKALELDDTLAEAHSVLGAYKEIFEWDWPSAEAEHKRAMSLDPNSADVRGWYSGHLMNVGRFDEAVAESIRSTNGLTGEGGERKEPGKGPGTPGAGGWPPKVAHRRNERRRGRASRLRMTAGSAIVATRRSRPPQREHANTSSPNGIRTHRRASRPRVVRGAPAGAPGAGGLVRCLSPWRPKALARGEMAERDRIAAEWQLEHL